MEANGRNPSTAIRIFHKLRPYNSREERFLVGQKPTSLGMTA
jgi:hypothetical protein